MQQAIDEGRLAPDCFSLGHKAQGTGTIRAQADPPLTRLRLPDPFLDPFSFELLDPDPYLNNCPDPDSGVKII